MVPTKSVPVLFVTIILLLESHNHFVASQEKSCKAALQDVTKMQLGLMGQCAKSMKFKNGKEKSKKQNCILRCVMIKAELLNSEGQATLESVDLLLNKYMPPSVINRANETFFPCMEMGIKEPFKTVEDDPFCSSYDPFIKCFMQRVGSMCD